MGVIMDKILKKYHLIAALVIFITTPLLFYVLGDVPKRTCLKESISILTILAFFIILGQFYLTRSNKASKVHKMAKVIKLHKIIGYVFVCILLLHPFLIVFPRYFEAGVDPIDAFITMVTTFNSLGIILGIIAWLLMLVLGLTSLLRNKIGLKYTTWRLIHGILSTLFVVLAAWHAINLGRHTDLTLSIYIVIVAAVGIQLLLRTYFFKPKKMVDN